MRQRWACITHRQLGGPCRGLWASAHPVLAAQWGGPQHSPQPTLCLVLYQLSPLLNRRAPLWRFVCCLESCVLGLQPTGMLELEQDWAMSLGTSAAVGVIMLREEEEGEKKI